MRLRSSKQKSNHSWQSLFGQEYEGQENEIPYESLYFVGKAEKANVSSELGIRVFVEDQLSNARLLAKVCERVFLINRPYNQGIVQSPIVRVSSLSEAGSSLWAPSNQKRFASLSS